LHPLSCAAQGDGNLVLYTKGRQDITTAIWSSRTNWGASKAPYRLVMQGDGNLVVYSTTNGAYVPLWASGTHGHGSARLVVQDDRNVVVYRDSDNVPIWATMTQTRSCECTGRGQDKRTSSCSLQSQQPPGCSMTCLE
jgi:hypothetical protein